MTGKLTKAQRAALQREMRQLEEESNELARRAQRIRRQLSEGAERTALREVPHE